MNSDLVARVREFIEMEAVLVQWILHRLPLNMFTVCGGKIELNEIEEAMKAL